MTRPARKAGAKSALKTRLPFFFIFYRTPSFFVQFLRALFFHSSLFFPLCKFLGVLLFLKGVFLKKRNYKRPLFHKKKRGRLYRFFLCALFPPAFFLFSPAFLSGLISTRSGRSDLISILVMSKCFSKEGI